MVDQPPSFLYLVVLGIYVLVMLALGFFANRKVQTVEDYLVAGRKLPFYLAVPTIVAAWYGTGFCMGVSGLVYSKGVPAVLADPFGSTCALLLAGLFFAGRFRRMRLLTVADILGRAYGKRMEVCASLLMMPFYIGTLAAQMVALGYLLHLFAHIDTNTAIIMGSALMAIYTMAGGMWAVSFTDFLQLSVLLMGMILILPTVFSEFQDPHTFTTLKNEFASLLPHKQEEGTGYLVYAGQLLITGVGAVMGQDLVQRCLATRSERTARWSVLCAAVVYFTLGMLPIAIGVAGRSLVPGLESPELLIPHLAQKYLSPVMVVIFVGGLILAIMSTADSYLLAGTSILTLNVILPMFPQKTESARLWMLRGCSLIMTAIAFLLAKTGFNIFQLVIHSGAMLFVAIFFPVTMTLYYKRASSQAAWSALFGGVISWLCFVGYAYTNLGMAGDSLLYAAATVGGLGSLTTYVIVSVARMRKTVELDAPLQATEISAA
ncbi:MAG: sodium:solute symporter family protein [Chlamydiales bacterium]|nr:sodium:solute symporter family protein [Chlamydiales bacterium]